MEGSTFKVSYTKILDILPHDNADRLEIAQIYGFNVVISKGSLKVGDLVFYIPIDSVLPDDLENIVFPEGSKIKLNKRRVKQIRIRKYASQGLIISEKHVNKLMEIRKKKKMTFKEEVDYSKELGIGKYEPPTPGFQQVGNKKIKSRQNPYFKKYGGIDNYKWFPNLFKEGESVVITEKIHGAHIRFGYAPYCANTFWKKIKKLFNLTPKYEWVYGSNNVQLQDKINKKGYYGDDVYGKLLEKYDAKNKVPEGCIVHGELYGSGIQKNYNYGCKEGEHKLIIFDVKKDGEYQSFEEVKLFGKTKGFDVVPVVFDGEFNLEKTKDMTLGKSILAPSQKVREGVVIKNKDVTKSRKVLKLISEKYLDKDQSDFH